MTPLHMDILMHYFSCTNDFDIVETNNTRSIYAYELAELGYLYTPNNNNRFKITRHGRNTVKAVLEFFFYYTKEE